MNIHLNTTNFKPTVYNIGFQENLDQSLRINLPSSRVTEKLNYQKSIVTFYLCFYVD